MSARESEFAIGLEGNAENRCRVRPGSGNQGEAIQIPVFNCSVVAPSGKCLIHWVVLETVDRSIMLRETLKAPLRPYVPNFNDTIMCTGREHLAVRANCDRVHLVLVAFEL
jgi:hypothetical protein